MIDNNMMDRATAYTDLASLEKIKLMKNDQQALTKVAKQFEGIFLNMMLKSMRSANEAFSKDNFLTSKDVKFYQNMLDNQLSISLSDGEGMGLAKMLVRQLSHTNGHTDSQTGDQTGDQTGIDMLHTKESKSQAVKTGSPAEINPSTREEKSEDTSVNKNSVTNSTLPSIIVTNSSLNNTVKDNSVKYDVRSVSSEKLHEAYGRAEESVSPVLVLDKIQFESPQEFIDYILPIANKVVGKDDIDPRLLVAQAALETGWGQHPILHKEGSPSFNLFGIKASNGWVGDQVEVMTTEFEGGKESHVKASFRSYPSYEESFRDYINFVHHNARYSSASQHAKDPSRYINELHKAGYATDPHYADKVMRIFSSEEVQQAPTDQSASIKPVSLRG